VPGNDSFTFNFTNTQEDLVDCAEAWRNVRIGRRFARLGMAAFGALWLVGGLYAIFVVANSRQLPLAILFAVLGGVLVWRYGLRPSIENQRIRKAKVPAQTVSLTFGESGIDVHESGAADVHQSWSEVNAILPASNGVVVGFRNAIVNWLPDRAFRNRDEREAFIRFAREQLSRARQPSAIRKSSGAPSAGARPS
jgi:hypothetical protein